MQPKVESIQVGRPRHFVAEGDLLKLWSSAIVKHTVAGSVFVGETGLAGDEQSDLVHHGGPDKAVLAYASAHYRFWASCYPSHDFAAGGFGENLTLSGIDEKECCIGDVFEIGGCVLELSQPRQPCWKLSKRWGLPKLAQEVQNERRTGWYLRVLRKGFVEAGDAVTLIERPNPGSTVLWALDVMYAKPRSRDDDARLVSLPQLSESWRKTLSSRAVNEPTSPDNKRLFGG